MGSYTTIIYIFILAITIVFAKDKAARGNHLQLPPIENDDEDRLMIDLFKQYNSYIHPVNDNSTGSAIIIKLSLALNLLISISEKNQVMHTNIWLTKKWNDSRLMWSPENYGGIKEIRVAPEKIWLPDIVLFNNADGNYELSYMCNVIISNTGEILWVPPSIFKSSCVIDVEFFPFDEQTCHLIFGSWTYNSSEVKLDFLGAEYIDLSEYTSSGIWNVIDARGALTNKRSRIEFQLKVRRKPLFYSVVLICPVVFMAFLSMSVFYLPTQSGEKMGLTMNVLLSIVVFLLLVSKILPPTSSSIPLIAKYLLLTFVLNIITIVITVVIINVHFRKPSTHPMSPFVKTVFLRVLPRILCIERPKLLHNHKKRLMTKNDMLTIVNNTIVMDNFGGSDKKDINYHHPFCHSNNVHLVPKGMAESSMKAGYEMNILQSETKNEVTFRKVDDNNDEDVELSENAIAAIEAVAYITNNMKAHKKEKSLREDWKYVSMTIDRLLLYFFIGVTLGSTYGIIATAPTFYERIDQQTELTRLIHLYRSGAKG